MHVLKRSSLACTAGRYVVKLHCNISNLRLADKIENKSTTVTISLSDLPSDCGMPTLSNFSGFVIPISLELFSVLQIELSKLCNIMLFLLPLPLSSYMPSAE